MNILGISCFYHDAAAALVMNGQLVAAAEEERFSRKKHDSGFPLRAIRFCLEAGQLTMGDLDYVVFYEKPFTKFERILQTILRAYPRSARLFQDSMLHWLMPVKARARDQLPAITHVDGSARPQTVNRELNPRYHRLIEAFDEVTGTPVLLNTSFNLKGEPIVATPTDALSTFARSGLDLLVLDDGIVQKA